ncbi:hypothetical protein AB1N83_011864, partial [Pleurotus pulmonarius]
VPPPLPFSFRTPR